MWCVLFHDFNFSTFFALKCVFQCVTLHGCVFFVQAIQWAQSFQCVPPRVLKCTLRTTGSFSPQQELLSYCTSCTMSFSLFLSFPFSLSLFTSIRSVCDQTRKIGFCLIIGDISLVVSEHITINRNKIWLDFVTLCGPKFAQSLHEKMNTSHCRRGTDSSGTLHFLCIYICIYAHGLCVEERNMRCC